MRSPPTIVADEEEEDLSKIAWGAGLAGLLATQVPNFIFFTTGFTLLALPCYLILGHNERYLSKDGDGQHDSAFPIMLSIALGALCCLLFCEGAHRRASQGQRS